MSTLISQLAKHAAKAAALDPSIANAIGLGGAGALAGGVIGGLGGMMGGHEPDHELEVGPDGQLVPKKKKNGLMSGIGGALTGAALGGLGGAAIGGLGTEAVRHFGPKVQGMMDQSQAKSDLAANAGKPLGIGEWYGSLGNAAGVVGDLATATGWPSAVKNYLYDNSSRGDQFGALSQSMPWLTDNPLAGYANKANDYLSSLMPGAQ